MEASKALVAAVTSLYEATKVIVEGDSRHAQPKALAHRTLALARDLIAKAKAYHISTRKDDESEVGFTLNDQGIREEGKGRNINKE